MNPHYPTVAQRADGRCEYCRAPELVFNFAFEVDHILPRFAGGDDSPDNLALACESCNLYKSFITGRKDESEARVVLLYHPRRDRWDAHFRFDSETCQVHGLSATGRVTVIQLKMNSGFQIRAREQWLRLGLYP